MNAGVSGRRVLLVDYHLLADDVAATLTAWGAHVRRLYPAELRLASFQQACREHEPHLVFSVNHAPPLAFLSTAMGVPYVSWSIDPLGPERWQVLPGTDLGRCLCFVHRRALLPELLGKGFARVMHLPLGAARRRVVVGGADEPAPGVVGADEPARAGEVTFVAGSLLSDERALVALQDELGWDSALRAQVDEWLESAFVAGADDPSFMGIDGHAPPPAWLAAHVAVERWPTIVDALNGRLGYWHRRRVVRRLSEHGLVVYGDEGWAASARDYRGLVSHRGVALTALYRSSLANLDVPRLYQREIVTLRAVDVLAAGALLITEAGGELAELVPEDGYLAYRTLDELVEQIEALRRDPASARERARVGQRAVLAEHLLEHRLERITRVCRALGWL